MPARVNKYRFGGVASSGIGNRGGDVSGVLLLFRNEAFSRTGVAPEGDRRIPVWVFRGKYEE